MESYCFSDRAEAILVNDPVKSNNTSSVEGEVVVGNKPVEFELVGKLDTTVFRGETEGTSGTEGEVITGGLDDELRNCCC